MKRIIDINTHEFIRDIDLEYDQPNSSYENEQGEMIQRENEIAIQAPACEGDKRIANFNEQGDFVSWELTKGQHEPKGNNNDKK